MTYICKDWCKRQIFVKTIANDIYVKILLQMKYIWKNVASDIYLEILLQKTYILKYWYKWLIFENTVATDL